MLLRMAVMPWPMGRSKSMRWAANFSTMGSMEKRYLAWMFGIRLMGTCIALVGGPGHTLTRQYVMAFSDHLLTSHGIACYDFHCLLACMDLRSHVPTCHDMDVDMFDVVGSFVTMS